MFFWKRCVVVLVLIVCCHRITLSFLRNPQDGGWTLTDNPKRLSFGHFIRVHRVLLIQNGISPRPCPLTTVSFWRCRRSSLLRSLPRTQTWKKHQIHHFQDQRWQDCHCCEQKIIRSRLRDIHRGISFIYFPNEKELPDNDCRYAVYDFEFTKGDEGKRNKICFYAYLPLLIWSWW